MLKYEEIKERYGRNTNNLVKRLEKKSRAYGRHTSHLHFNLHCKHQDIIPTGIKIKSQERNPKARIIIHKTEKALLNIRISETIEHKKKLENEKKEIEDELSLTLTE